MSGIISGFDYSTLFSASSTASSNVLSILASSTQPGSAASFGANPLVALKLAQANQTKSISTEQKSPDVARDLAAFTKAVASAKTIQAALQNPAVLKVLLTANGLGDQTSYIGLASKALMSDPSNAKSVANQLSGVNANWLSTVKSFNFFANGLSALSNPAVQATLAQGYAEVRWRQSLDATTPGMSNALTFINGASAIKTVDQVLGDSVNRDVVLTALNIPPQLAYQPLASQENFVASRLDLSKLQDAHFVQTLAQRYLLNKQASSGTTSSGSAALSLLT